MAKNVNLYSRQWIKVSHLEPNEHSWPVGGGVATLTYREGVVLTFTLPATRGFNPIQSASLHVIYSDVGNRPTSVSGMTLPESVDLYTTSWASLPIPSRWPFSVSGYPTGSVSLTDAQAAEAAQNGVLLYVLTDSITGIDLSTSATMLQVTVDETTVVAPIITQPSPSGGAFVDRTTPATFRWAIQPDGYCLRPLTQMSGTFEWRQGSDGTVHSITLGSDTSVTVPAGTLPQGEIQWRVTALSSSGESGSLGWQTATTVDVLSSATPIAPVNEMADGSADTLFRWAHVISTGTAPTGYDLQILKSGSWISAAFDHSTAATSATIPVGTLTSAVTAWRVRTYNSNGEAGSWSDPAQIQVLSAADPPLVTVPEATPRARIAWQSAEQLAWEAQIDGISSGVRFGHDSSWRCPAYLEDGNHLARVRVQNAYALWSDWGTAAFSVTAETGSAINLVVTAGSDARLAWATTGTYDAFIVYRDGTPIARTAQTSYVDRASVGETVYTVRGIFGTQGGYGLSNAVTVTVAPDHVIVGALEDEGWIELPYSAEQHQTVSDQRTAQSSTYHVSGRALPSADVTEWRDMTWPSACSPLCP